MKISNIIIASIALLFASCSGNQSNNHGHDHGIEEHGHEHGNGEHHQEHQQEEFNVPSDSVQTEEPTTHTHDDGSEHHDH